VIVPSVTDKRRTIGGRARILDAALSVFAARGFDAASIAEIGERAGIAKSVMYHHFGSKRGLYEAILEARTEELVQRVKAVLAKDPNAPRLRAGLDAYLAFLEENPRVWALLYRDPPLDSDVLAVYESQRGRRTQAIADLVTPAVAAGPDPAAKRLHTELLITAVRAFTAWWHDHPDVPRERVLDAILAFGAAGAQHLSGRPAVDPRA
jgi:AcrR family transcriptional regulator